MNWFTANTVLLQSTVTTLLLAMSIQYPMRVGVFSFAGAGLFGIGGYTAGVAMTRLGFGTWPAIWLGVVFAAVAGLLLGLVLYRLAGLYLAMATIAFDLIVIVVAGNLDDVTGGQTGLYGAVGHITLGHLAIVAVLLIAAFALTERGGMSRRIEAVHDDPALASSMGISVGRYRLTSFLVSGIVAGLGGGLLVLMRTAVTPDAFGFQLVVLALTVVVVGGSRSWVGAVLGTIIFTWLPVYLAVVGEWRNVVYGLIVTVAAIYFPGGIWGSVLRSRKWLQQHRRAGVVTQGSSE
jgi:ABC-type branched-subunit amino acid transport system permease subunit